MIQITTKIADTNSKLELLNKIDNFASTVNLFQANQIHYREKQLTVEQAPNEIVDLFELFNIIPDNCSLIAVQLKDVDQANTVNDNRFVLEIDSRIICKTSQFILANINELFIESIKIYFESVSKTVLLGIVVLEK